MTRDIKRAGLLVGACGLALLAAMPLVRGEISRTGEPAPPPERGEITLVPVAQPLRAQCWQEGVKIIDQAGLEGLALNQVLKQQSVSFRGSERGQPETLILPFADGMCLIQPER
jgi:hypothetical protein